MDMSPGREKDRGVVELDVLRASGAAPASGRRWFW
jgi:hypothetical protein